MQGITLHLTFLHPSVSSVKHGTKASLKTKGNLTVLESESLQFNNPLIATNPIESLTNPLDATAPSYPSARAIEPELLLSPPVIPPDALPKFEESWNPNPTVLDLPSLSITTPFPTPQPPNIGHIDLLTGMMTPSVLLGSTDRTSPVSQIDTIPKENLSTVLKGSVVLEPSSSSSVFLQHLTTLDLAENNAQIYLTSFFAQKDWQSQIQVALGASLNPDQAASLTQDILHGDLHIKSLVKVLPAEMLKGANGAFDSATNTIYLSDALIAANEDRPEAIANVLLEEFGHYLDSQLNQSDSQGDEGQIFSLMVQSNPIAAADLVMMKVEDDHATLTIDGQARLVELSAPSFAIKTEGTFTMNGSGDLNGDPLILSDDALVYAAKGFTINGNPTLPVQYDSKGKVLKDASGKSILVNNAVTVSPGYTVSTGPSNKYAGLTPPMAIAPLSVTVPLYADLKAQTLASRVPAGTPEIVLDASQNPLNSLADWTKKFPPAGTSTQPRVVRVINGGLNIPDAVSLSNYAITVVQGDINFNGGSHNFNNVVMIANSGNVNVDKVNGTDLAVFASGSVNLNGSAKFFGLNNLVATGSANGNVAFNGSTNSITGTDQVRVVSQGSIAFNGSTNTRGSFTSVGSFTLNGNSTIYGLIEAKGNISFNGNTTVFSASIVAPNPNQAPTNLTLSANTIAENTPINTVVGTFSSTDPNTGDKYTYQLISGAGDTDNAAFNIASNQLRVNASPDFEAKSSYSIRVRTTDQGGLSYEKTLEIAITDVNESSTSLFLSNSITPENVAAGSVIGTFATTDPDTNNTFTYSLVTGTGSTDNAAVTITGNQLKINASPDFESKSSYNILVRTTDQGGLSYDKSLVIGITDVNEAPTSLVLSNNITPENVVAGSVIGTFASTDPDTNNTFAYSLVSGTGATDNAAFSIVGNQLKINASPDFESKSSYSVRVKTTDQGGLSYEKTFAIASTDLNEAPTDLNLSLSNTLENVAPGSTLGNFSTTDPDANNAFSYSLVSGTGSTDNAAFSVVGNQLNINASPNFEAKSSYSVRVRTTDQGGLSGEKVLTVSILNVNEAPTAIALTNASLPENSLGGTVIGQLSTIDPDQGDTQQYTLTDSAGDRFEIVSNTLRVKAGAALDFESTPSFIIEVKSTDAGGLSTTQRFAIALTNVNEAPINLALSTTSLSENTPIGSVVGTLSATDPDQNDTLQYSLVAGTGDIDNAAFEIVNNQLQLQTKPNFATHPSYSIRVKATDAGGLSVEKVLSLSVLDTTAPLIQAGLAYDTAPNGQTNTDSLTSDPSIQGTVTDNGSVAQLRAWFNGQTHDQAQSVQPSPNGNGQFQLSRAQLETIYGRLLGDGQYTFNLEAVDGAGNASTVAIHFTLDTTAPAIAGFNLASGSDTAPTGDFKTKQSVVDVVGQSDPNALVKLINTGTTLTVDGTGQFQFTNLPLALGDNLLTIQVTDTAGNTQTITQTITRVNGGDVVTEWNAIALEAIRTDRTAPPRAAYILAMVHTSIFDAVAAIDQKYDVYQIDVTAAPNASPEAAAIAAAHRILVHYFPHQQAVLDLAYTQALAKIQDGTAENDGIALGVFVAHQMLAFRANDGTEAVVAETPSTELGQWRPTLPKYEGAALPQWPDVQPFALVDGAQFRPDGPPALDSTQYAADYIQTKDLGAKNSTTRTADQTQIAKFWADGAGTYTPPGHWNQIAQAAAANSGNSLIDNARLFALLDVSLADSGIAAWDAKYQYDFWRPITAIQQGEVDGNPFTLGDPTWTPLINTPPFPEYVSGHSTFSGAASTILTNAFGSNYSFTTTSYGLTGITRSFTSFDQAADQAGMSRIYGGIHFNSANQDGLALGREVGSYVSTHYFQPVNRSTVLQATLANDTAPVGTTNRDKITSNPTITGKVTGTSVVIKAGLDLTSPADYQNITAFLDTDGRFTLNEAALSQLSGGTLQDGIHTVHFQVFNAQGSILENQDLAFVLDRGTPLVSLEAPTTSAIYSPTAHLKGKIIDTLSQGGTVRYSVDGQAFQQFKANASGQFDQIISSPGLGVGTHQIAVEIYDGAGNMTPTAIAFTVSDQFSTGGALTNGWGAQSADTLSLYEGNSFEVQKVMPVEVGVSAGTRTIEFDVSPNWDLKDIDVIAQDRLLVYLVNPSNPSQTLLDGGEAGTALFSLSGTQAEYRPGLVRFDGRHVSIDVSSLPAGTTGNLVFQLLNLDGDTGSSVQVRNLSNTVDVTGTPSPIFPVVNQRAIAGPAVSLDSYLSNPDAKVLLSNVHLEPTTGRLLADLRVQNIGSAPISSKMAVLFLNLPNGVSLLNASGTHAAGSPYLNLKSTFVDGDLKAGATSGAMQVVISDPNLIQFDLQTVVLMGALTQPPQLQALGTLNVTAGARLEVPLTATSVDGELVTLSLRDANNLPMGQLANGRLTFTPSPTDVGAYHFTLVATSDGLETTQSVTLNVAADPITTTRVSGVVQNTDQMPLAGILVDVDGWQAVTDVQGRFTVTLEGLPTSNNLRIMGGLSTGSDYPSIAEKLPLVLEHEVYEGVNNEIARPIYLPVLDIAGGQVVDSFHDAVVTSAKLPGAAVTVKAGSLKDQSGNSFTGTMSITEVPVNLTPAALPGNLRPDLVVTIQPGEMNFTTPAPLSLPNRVGYAPGMLMDLWSINPITGKFDNVGTGQVSADGSVINTISGGVKNSSWHFYCPAPLPSNPGSDPYNAKGGCDTGKPESVTLNSSADLQTGAVEETHDLAGYQSLGINRGLSLHYDSLRADPRPIVHIGFPSVNPYSFTNAPERVKLVAKLSLQHGNFTYQVPGSTGGRYGLTGGENIWSIPANNNGGAVNAALQADLSALPSGQYQYTLESGINIFVSNQYVGTSTVSTNTLISVNSINSAFGSGWGLSGLQQLVENDDRSILLIDGNGSEMLFQAPAKAGDPYISPPGHFSTLARQSDGTFTLTEKDQTVSTFNAQNQLVRVEDSNHNATQYLYDGNGNLSQVIDPVGLTTTFTYTGNRITSITDPAGRITRMSYDAAGNLTSITDPDGAQNTWEYDDKHHMTANTDPNGNRGTDSYDFAGRVTGAIRKDGSVVQINPVEVQGLYRPEQTINPDPFAAPSTFQLGAPKAFQVDGNGNTSRIQIDQAGQLVSSADGVGKQTTVTRNGQNLVSSQTDGLNHTVVYTYDERGNILSSREELPASKSAIEHVGTSLKLDGINDYVQLKNSAIVANSPNSTVEAWVKLDSIDRYQMIYSEDNPGGTVYQLSLSGSILNFGTWRGGWNIISAPVDIDVNKWFHVAGVIDANEGLKLYFNGELLTSNKNPSPSDQNIISVQAGRAINIGGIAYLGGQIDELRAWKVARDASEIQQNKDRKLLAFNSDLVGYWNFDEGAGVKTVDQTSKNQDGSLINGVAWSDNTPGLIAQPFKTEVIYSEDFEYGIGSEWSSSTLDNTYSDKFTRFSGRFSNADQTLSISTVPGETYQLKFDLYGLDSWDGPGPYGPDYFDIFADNSQIFHEVVAGFKTPNELIGFPLYFNGNFADYIFRDLLVSFSAQSTTTKIRFSASGLEGLNNESWGIDNVEVEKLIFDSTQTAQKFFTYDSRFNKLTSTTDELGRKTLFDIDPLNGNIVSMTQVVGAVGGNDDLITRYTYTNNGLVDLLTDPLGRVTDYDYTTEGRIAKITVAKGTVDEATQSFEYDLAGNQTAIIDAKGDRTEFEYDALNRLKRKIEADPDGISGPLSSPVTIYTYDAAGNLVLVKDARSNTTTYAYDNLNRRVKTIDALLGETNYRYDNAGNLIAQTDALGHTTQSRYDSRNRLKETIDAEGAIAKYGYDANNNLTSVTEFTELPQTIFFEDFESDLSKWTGRTSSNGQHSGVIQSDPLETDHALAFESVISGGDFFTKQGLTLPGHSYRLSFDYLGLPKVGSQPGDYGGFIGYSKDFEPAGFDTFRWLAGTDTTSQADPSLIDDGTWHHYSIDFKGFSDGNPFHLMLEDFRGIPGDAFFDNLRVEALPTTAARKTTYTYDARNRRTSETDPLGQSTTYEYDLANNLTAQVDRNQHRTEFTYDDLNRQISTKDALGGISTHTYDKASNLIAATDELGRTTQYAYDNRDRLLKLTHPSPYNADSVTYSYDAVGNLRFITDELNRTTEYRYDALNRRTETLDPLQHQTRYEYDSVGNLTAIEDALHRRTTLTYDALNRQTLSTNPLGDTVAMRYDAVGNTTAITDELERTTTFAYDKRNAQTQVTDALGHASTTTYDLLGRVTSQTDALGHRSLYRYDSLDRLIESEDALGAVTAYGYDAEGDRTRVTDAKGNTTTFSYDALDRLTKETTASGTRTYGYDAVGNQTSMVDRNGRQQNFGYDERDRLIQERWIAANGSTLRNINRSYDAASQLTAISDADSRYVYTYDKVGRLTSIDNTGTPGVPTVVLDYTYDAVNNLISVTDSINGQQAGTTVYSYDTLDRTTQITQSGNGVSNKRIDLAYNKANQTTQIGRYADLSGTALVAQSDYSYDPSGKLTRLTHKRNSTTYADYLWSYDSADRITQFVSPDGTSNYSYNSRDELTGTDRNYQTDEAYSYDATGNRTNAGYQTGQDNRLLSDGTYSYTYDNEGNRTSRTNIASGEVTQYTWDYRNRLTSVVTKDSGGTVTKSVAYTYDVYDRRIAKLIDPDGAGLATPQTERMVYDGDNIALTFDGTGTQTHRYLYGPGVDQILADETPTSMNWALVDNQGTVRDVIDSQGQVLNHIVYDSYGQVTSETNLSFDFRYGYTGRERDEETGLDYYRSRYYDPANGRFISEDTIGFNGGDVNLYRYVANSPIRFTDPNGTDLYDVVNGADQLAAGFGDAVTFGGTTKLREAMYGETATRNHSGGLFTTGQVLGTGASIAVGVGAPGTFVKGALLAERFAQGYTAVGAGVGAYQSTRHIIDGCATPWDALAFAPVAGHLGGRVLRGLGVNTPLVRKFPNLYPEDVPNNIPRRELFHDGTKWRYTASNGKTLTPNGRYNFVTQDGKIYIARQKLGGIGGHTDIAKGKEVDFAGQIRFGSRPLSRGKISSWNNGSGHYKIPAEYASQARLPIESFIPYDFNF
jgi:RHS repeat-associated protein